jgi:hypothetical protein
MPRDDVSREMVPGRGPRLAGDLEPGDHGGGRSDEIVLSHDRDWIAHEVTDVVRLLFAVGLDLEKALAAIGAGYPAEKIDSAIDGLNLAIRDMRDTIFDTASAPPQPRQRVIMLIDSKHAAWLPLRVRSDPATDPSSTSYS